MYIRRPPGEVFAAFVNPQTLRKFWLSDASGPLAPGARVQWTFMVPGATTRVAVTAFESPNSLSYEWDGGLHIDMTFDPFAEGGTRLSVAISGFSGDDLMAQVADTVEGFSIVLCDLKTLLETGESAGLVRDKAAVILETMGRKLL
jgi:uncharacterized protein YndB with AHSA1/START domain